MKTLLKTHGKKITAVSLTMAMFLLSGCGGSAAPQEETPTDETTTPVQTQQTSTTTGNPSQAWELHMTTKKLFPGNPEITVHKYCKTVVGNMTQCQLYDGNDSDSRLVGVETMVGPEMYGTFTPDEKKLWMPTKDLMLSTQAAMPELSAEQFSNVANSLANKYSKVYLLWDPGKINLPTGNPMITVMNTAVATGTTNISTTTPAPTPATPGTTAPSPTPATPASTTTPAPAPVSSGGFSFATFDTAKLVAGGLDQKKGNFESSVLQTGGSGSVQLVSLKGNIASHTFANTTQIIYITSGSGEFTIGDKKQTVTTGMVVVIPNGIAHSFKNSGTKDKPLVFVNFKTPFDDTNVKWN